MTSYELLLTKKKYCDKIIGKGSVNMEKKLYFLIALAHLAVPISLLTPIITITETKVGIGGTTVVEMYNINFFQYFLYDVYSTLAIFMLIFSVVELLGAVNGFYAAFTKKPNHVSYKASFYLGFSSAVMAALQAGSNSYAFFFICVISFLVISFCSIKLMKSDGK